MKTYGKGELAALYMPSYTVGAARKLLTKWINQDKTLKTKLEEAGYSHFSKVLTPKQTEIIFEHLGNPEDYQGWKSKKTF